MCVIAGYIGSRPAAPILIEMLRRQEGIGGGFFTGIATVHEGKLHNAKLTGDLARLEAHTEAASLPG
ncbi:MAG: glutamine--fructose-6-phosphate aminotransferase, partial [Clostridia bacterium]|nr:glutamine--fructose-6-phosphate aminotransferase [Clostridia bacterium]